MVLVKNSKNNIAKIKNNNRDTRRNVKNRTMSKDKIESTALGTPSNYNGQGSANAIGNKNQSHVRIYSKLVEFSTRLAGTLS